MQPYVNPYLFSNPIYGNCVPNPMPQAPAQPIGISGKYVNDFNEVNVADIPMNGPAIFAKNDRSEIQVREWNPNGQITTTSYRAVVEAPEVVPDQPRFNARTEVLEPILDRLTSLEEKLDKMNKPTVSRTKKDGE